MESEIQSEVTKILGEYGWMFVVALVAFFFRNTVEKIIDGLQVFMGGDYNSDDVMLEMGRLLWMRRKVGQMWELPSFTNKLEKEEKNG